MLIAGGIHALPVLDGDEITGVVTGTDLVDGWSDDTTVASAMTPVPTVIDQTASLGEAAQLMIDHRLHHLLVTDGNDIVGIMSTFDLLSALTEEDR